MAKQNPALDKPASASQTANENPGVSPVEAGAGAGEGEPVSSRLTKTQAVQQALAAGQNSAKDAVQWIKEQYNLEVAEATFNSYKSALRNKAKQAESSKAPEEEFNGEIDILEALKFLKGLVRLYGAEKVKGLVDLLNS